MVEFVNENGFGSLFTMDGEDIFCGIGATWAELADRWFSWMVAVVSSFKAYQALECTATDSSAKLLFSFYLPGKSVAAIVDAPGLCKADVIE